MSHQGPDLLELWNNHCGFFMWLALALISHTKLGSLISGYEKRSYPQGRICFCQWDGEIKEINGILSSWCMAFSILQGRTKWPGIDRPSSFMEHVEIPSTAILEAMKKLGLLREPSCCKRQLYI